MTRSANTAEQQLERILYILPAAARGSGVRIDDIARALDVDAATVLRDLEDATARVYYHPGGSVEPFTITTDGSTLQVHAPREFRRPVRLNEREALALGLGLRTLAADAEAERRAQILAFASRLEAELAVPDVLSVREAPAVAYDMAAPPSPAAYVAEPEVEYAELALDVDDDGFRSVVADAIEFGRLCTIWYLKPGDIAPMQRGIAPYRLVYSNGMWYVAAYDMERDGLRYFRMDRVLDAQLSAETALPAPPALKEMLARGVPYAATEEIEVSVRYSSRISRWIVERVPAAQLERDGTVVLQHRVGDPRWIVRHVLQYAGDAVIEEPPRARSWLRSAAGRI